MQHRADKEGIHETKLLTYCPGSFIIFDCNDSELIVV